MEGLESECRSQDMKSPKLLSTTLIALSALAVLMAFALTVALPYLLRASAFVSHASGDLDQFSALSPIDAHVHIFKNDPAFGTFLSRMNLRILNICVVDKHDRGYEEAAPQHRTAREILHSTEGRAAWYAPLWTRWTSISQDSLSNG
jgi:hypothetical protein